MNRGTEMTFRLLGAVVGAITLLFAVLLLNQWIVTLATPITTGAAVVAGVLIGIWAGPRPIRNAQLTLSSVSMEELGGLLAGGLLGLLAGALAAIPLSRLPSPFAQVLPLVITIALTYLGAITLMHRPHDLIQWMRIVRPRAIRDVPAEEEPDENVILLDTSVIIDGRITDISRTGFLSATLLVPGFILSELQHIADSPDPIRRKRGRRGLEVLNVLRTECPIPFEITDMDVSEVREADAKLVALARHVSCPIMTNDYNLNRVAGLQGVNVLNINDLANAVKAAYLPGEELDVRIIQEGREQGQGVGYLEDGTMVVVEDGRYHMNDTLVVVVTKVLQTSAGRMIFAKIP